ncbi:hypothetical protein C1N80_09440 [Brachybacterium sp. SGAir0954]|uniref:DUF664 domain-containing protein n=1 Tax=Brachybacterium sp. SGAir0954 TaxID=2571029 RepID=UPI0010CCE39A|nr:DUF664 domain-containing protein [Brachybacterium sp. SGAir0954]QCR53776.1 hypothetical protein C1N80_09440 [Brachybacterium sp. SGAir0954]
MRGAALRRPRGDADGPARRRARADRLTRRGRLVDILEENLLHPGQASTVREAIDGLVGDDPP